MPRATSRRNSCPEYPARSSSSRRFCGIHHVRRQRNMALLIPHDFSKPGGERETLSSGYTVLASDPKGSLVRLDRDVPGSTLAFKDSVFYAAHSQNTDTLLAIRLANQDDRSRRFRRPAYLDHLVANCCNQPSRYMSIYDDGSGRFFDLDVLPQKAATSGEGRLFYLFMCLKCSQQKTFLL